MTCSGGRLVLVGEAPAGSGSEATPALEGLVGRRLAQMMGVDYAAYIANTTRRNLFETPDEGKFWYTTIARHRAIRLAGDFLDGDWVILLGAKVAAAFSAADLPLYRWTSWQRYQVARVPHPSGRNRMYNDPAEVERASRFLAEAAARA